MTSNSIHTLVFSCGNKRIIHDIENFIGKEVILWLTGIKERSADGALAPTKKHLNELGENVYFKDIIPISVIHWDMYMYTLKQNCVPDPNYIIYLVQFNEIIGGDSRIDKVIAIINENKSYNPLCPEQDFKKKYQWTVSVEAGIRQYITKGWSVSSNLDPQSAIMASYWLRKLKNHYSDYHYDGVDQEDYDYVSGLDDSDN
jgi:hypothetical protein